MARGNVCPACKRGTYSGKWNSCSAEGCRLNPRIQGKTTFVNTTAEFKLPPPGVEPLVVPASADHAPCAERIAFLEGEVARLKKSLAEKSAEVERLTKLALTLTEEGKPWSELRDELGIARDKTPVSVTENLDNTTINVTAVTEILNSRDASRKVGRPRRDGSKSAAERAKEYRQRKRGFTG